MFKTTYDDKKYSAILDLKCHLFFMLKRSCSVYWKKGEFYIMVEVRQVATTSTKRVCRNCMNVFIIVIVENNFYLGSDILSITF